MAQFGSSQLKPQWYACLPEANCVWLGPLRRCAGLEVLPLVDATVWLRGPRWNDEVQALLRRLLGCRIYVPLGDGQLVPVGKRLPEGYEPEGPWTPLSQWLSIVLPTTRSPAPEPGRCILRLVRSGHCRPPGLISVTRHDWLAYASTAPQIRLDRLMFATSDRCTVVLGSPLPPLRGEYYWICNGIAAPVGFSWQPNLDASVVGDSFQLAEGDVALLFAEGGCSIIRSHQFVGASRSAVRLTEGMQA